MNDMVHSCTRASNVSSVDSAEKVSCDMNSDEVILSVKIEVFSDFVSADLAVTQFQRHVLDGVARVEQQPVGVK